MLIVTPEYNRSIPGVLKNAIDWASRPYGKNSFDGKPTAALGTSGGAVGTAAAQQHLRSILAYLNVILMGQPEGYIVYKKDMVDDAGQVADESVRKFLQLYMDKFTAWVERFGGLAALFARRQKVSSAQDWGLGGKARAGKGTFRSALGFDRSVSAMNTETLMPILLWLLGVPLTLVIVLMLAGVV